MMGVGNKTFSLSFELFPPNTEKGFCKLLKTCDQLQRYNPEYFSVTFGSGGVDQGKTFKLVEALVLQDVNIVPHLTCIGLSRVQIENILRRYHLLGISQLVALRGDLLPGVNNSAGDFHYAYQLIEFIRATMADVFRLEVAAYPEFHPQSSLPTEGLQYFKQKVDAGADSAITQYFYDRYAYLEFMESLDKLGIHIPVVPGIMPISNFETLKRFSKRCGADIPLWLGKRLEEFGDDKDAVKAYGAEVVTRLCNDLIKDGVPGLHFYTLNQLEPTQEIIDNLSIDLSQGDAVVLN